MEQIAYPAGSQARELCLEEPFLSALHGQGAGELSRGALIGGVMLLDCVPTDSAELAGISDREQAFGDYGPGRYGWLLDRPTVFEPRPMRGALGLWTIPQVLGA